MTATRPLRPAVPARPARERPLPPLENGDRLTRGEFERRWEAMPHLRRAELINGVVHVAAAALRHKQHGQPHAHLITWLGAYSGLTPGIEVSAEPSLRMDEDNVPQPDAALLLPPHVGGTARVDDEGYLTGAPDLVAEVAASTASIDLHDKLHLYRRSGVREYVVWRVLDEAIDWFISREGRFEPLAADAEGILKSELFPGLWIEPAALLRGDINRLFELLRRGAATPEHAALVQRLTAPPPKASG